MKSNKFFSRNESTCRVQYSLSGNQSSKERMRGYETSRFKTMSSPERNIFLNTGGNKITLFRLCVVLSTLLPDLYRTTSLLFLSMTVLGNRIPMTISF